ncbi:M48 family metallopeptidase [Paracoccus sp. p3-h83]|uniref:M48 family metallopeptidase n=1 Tax=Paracoccus sp. p3-h83 TaxID=3342805 RepID=UPI0035B70BD1
MTQHWLPTDPPLELTLRRSARARRFSLRVSRLDGRVMLTLPTRASEAEALAFARSKADWLRQMQAAAPVGRYLADGQMLPVEGVARRLTPAPLRVPRIEGEALLVPAGRDPGPVVQAWLRQLARTRLIAACDRHAARLGRRIAAVSLRDTRSRWGSCTHDGRLMFSWRLILAPPEVLDYVAAHEVAHLAEMNHSPAFWAVVARLMPDYARHRDWLRRHGAGLHAWQFTARD